LIYSFGAFDLDTDVFELRRSGAPVAVEPQVFGVLAYLVEHRDRVVSKHELLDNVWGDRFVGESALTTRIKAARRAVGDDGATQGVIRTVHGRGYRFVAPVRDEVAAVPGRTGFGVAAGASEALAERTLASTWPMVGRGRELELVAERFRDGTGGVLLTGGAGVGKTRLAERALELAEAAGMPTARATGHPEGRSIPFAALSHLLPADIASPAGAVDVDRGMVFHRAAAALREMAGDQRLLLLVDDADQLDELSRALVASLVQSGAVFAVLTMRTIGGPTPFDRLVKDGSLERLTVEPLSVDSIETLLYRVLGGPIVADSLARLRDAALGSPGVLRQLVETAREAGVLTELNGVWRLTGPLQPTASFEQLVAERLRGLDDAHHHAAELLAIAGEVALDTYAATVGFEVLEDLERHGLLAVRHSGRRTAVSLAHPLFSEVLLRQLPALRGRRLRGELADALDAVTARRRDDRVRLVAWRLDAGGSVDREDVLHAARLALLEGDDSIAERLLRRAEEAGGGARATELLAELHFRRNEPERLEEVLAGIDLTELPEADRVRVVRRWSSNRFYALTDADGALAAVDETAHLFGEPWAVQTLAAHRATILSMAGRVGDALTCTEDLLAAGDPRLRFEVLRARSLALAAAGQGDDAIALVAEATDLHERFERDLTRPGLSILLFNHIFALTELGRLDEARTVGAEAAAGDVIGGRVSWLAFGRPRVELLAGNAAAALELSEGYALETRSLGAFGAERWILSLVGMARLLGGDVDGGGRDLDRVAELWPDTGYGGLFRSDRDRALGWLAMERSGAAAAHDVLRRGADLAGQRGAFALEAMLLHDVARFGGAATVADRLAELASTMQGPLATARAEHAAGVVAADCGRLAAVVAAFEFTGSPLLAAEASLDLADAEAAGGDSTAAAQARDRARQLLARLDGPVVTPRLRSAG
jgi:DNA-binding winged helix-turn-helix (wHTH) protein